jgi:alkane 1-monooxygenase
VPLRYLTPFAFLALLPLGSWLGGAWTFMAAAATPLCLTSLDAALGEEESGSHPQIAVARWLPRAYILAQLAVTGAAAGIAARGTTSLVEFLGLMLSAGVTAGVFGFLAAHEMIHSPDRRERALGLLFLAGVFYMHFRIAHVHGHHRRGATREDPATARLGESLYGFLPRTVAGQFREAWSFEAQRLRRRERRVIGPGNRMLLYLSIEALLLIVFALLSVRALVFVISVAALAVTMLEGFNYVAHYGLLRATGRDGRPERLAPHHSWNSRRRMNNAALFNMGRHSDHHRVMTRSFDALDRVKGSAQLPAGYAAALLTALIPPLWRKVMDRRVEAVSASRP